MYKKNTVFIVGAAASIKYGFPLGDQLTDDVSTMFGDYGKGNSLAERFRKNFKILGQEDILQNLSNKFAPQQIKNSAQKIHQGLHGMRSVDRYLQVHQDDHGIVFLGKLAIASSILKYERSSSLFKWQKELTNSGISTKIQKHNLPRNNLEKNIENLTNTWINMFFNKLSEGHTIHSVENIFKNVSIICFNYDRCIEFYLMELLVITFSLSRTHAAGILSTLDIIHPYGTIGDSVNREAPNYLPFGNTGDQKVDEFILAERIVTFTESTANKSEISEKIINAASTSEVMVILGFGFEEMKMKLLKLPVHKMGTIRNFYGTAFCEIDIGKAVIKEQLNKTFASNIKGRMFIDEFFKKIELFDDECEAMLQKIQRQL
ncbi:MAG: hypothetical protein COC24_015900 [Alphaproteobacteria bacterium]|nr:hypothetical protein [Alphaproteobacteria bacterium]